MKYKKGTFVTVPNKDMLRGLSPLTQTLFMWLCHYADDGGLCFPSIKRLSADTGSAERTVRYRLKELEDHRLITTVNRFEDGLQLTNLYQIEIVDCISCTTTAQHAPTPCTSVQNTPAPHAYRTQSNITQSNELKYGEFVNVKLSATEKEKLDGKYGPDLVAPLIEELSAYLESSGKRYKSHYATLLAWARRKGYRVERSSPVREPIIKNGVVVGFKSV